MEGRSSMQCYKRFQKLDPKINKGLWTEAEDAVSERNTLLLALRINIASYSLGLVVGAAGWPAGDPGSVLSRGSLCTFGCIPHSIQYLFFLPTERNCDHSHQKSLKSCFFLLYFYPLIFSETDGCGTAARL
jgi:hypothetical protein